MGLTYIASVALMLTQIITFSALLVKPIRERLMGMEDVREGHRCLLRSQIVSIYYRHVDSKMLKQYDYENLVACYKAYKKLGGNSFIDHIYNEMQEWSIH